MLPQNVVASHTMKIALTVAGVVVAAVLIWLVPVLGTAQQSANHLHASLDAVVSYYVTLGKQHAQGLQSAAGQDAADAADIAAAFAAVERATSSQQKQQTLAVLQGKLGAYFAAGRAHEPELQSDPHFLALQVEITGRGQAGALVQEYNKAALVAREQSRSFAGGVVARMFVGSDPQLLWIDGIPDTDPMRL